MKSKINYIVFIIGIIIGATLINIVLIPEFRSIKSRYDSLLSDYEKLDSVLHDPLTEYIIPEMDEFIDWLVNVDTTDEILYSEFFMCGDFAATLLVSGREMGWKIRRASMYYSYAGDAGYGDIANPYGSCGHAFNFIECFSTQDNRTIILYIEPQTDAVWFLGDRGMFKIWRYYTIGTKPTIWRTMTFFINHYSYTA